MMVWLTRLLGLAPKQEGKTGAREAANFAFLVNLLFLTMPVIIAAAYHNNPDFILHAAPLLAVSWTTSLGLFAYAYNLKSRKLEAVKIDSPNSMTTNFDDPLLDETGGMMEGVNK